MITVRFLSFLKSLTNVSEIELRDNQTVIQALTSIVEYFPKLSILLLDPVPEVSIIVDGKSILIPRDLKMKINQELVLSPIIAGG